LDDDDDDKEEEEMIDHPQYVFFLNVNHAMQTAQK